MYTEEVFKTIDAASPQQSPITMVYVMTFRITDIDYRQFTLSRDDERAYCL